MSGLLGWGAAFKAMHDCDALLLLGTTFPTRVHADQAENRPSGYSWRTSGRRSKLDLGLCGDVRETIKALLPLVEPKTNREFLDAMLEQQQASTASSCGLDASSTRRPIHPGNVAATLDELAAPMQFHCRYRNVLCLGRAVSQRRQGRRLLGSFVHGSMANALPQASARKRPTLADR